MTNADKIRAMTDEELAHHLYDLIMRGNRIGLGGKRLMNSEEPKLLEKLKQEERVDTDDNRALTLDELCDMQVGDPVWLERPVRLKTPDNRARGEWMLISEINPRPHDTLVVLRDRFGIIHYAVNEFDRGMKFYSRKPEAQQKERAIEGMTRGDKIRAMTDKELAKFICALGNCDSRMDCTGCIFDMEHDHRCLDGIDDESCMESWLKKEAKT